MATTKYVVAQPAAVIFCTDDTATTVYRGGPVPDGITDECRDRLLDSGFIVESPAVYAGGVGVDVPVTPAVPVESTSRTRTRDRS